MGCLVVEQGAVIECYRRRSCDIKKAVVSARIACPIFGKAAILEHHRLAGRDIDHVKLHIIIHFAIEKGNLFAARERADRIGTTINARTLDGEVIAVFGGDPFCATAIEQAVLDLHSAATLEEKYTAHTFALVLPMTSLQIFEANFTGILENDHLPIRWLGEQMAIMVPCPSNRKVGNAVKDKLLAIEVLLKKEIFALHLREIGENVVAFLENDRAVAADRLQELPHCRDGDLLSFCPQQDWKEGKQDENKSFHGICGRLIGCVHHKATKFKWADRWPLLQFGCEGAASPSNCVPRNLKAKRIGPGAVFTTSEPNNKPITKQTSNLNS